MRAPAILAILTAAALLAAFTSSAQSSTTPVPAHKPPQVSGHSAKTDASRPAAPVAPAAPAQSQTSLAPKPPNWPANDPPSKASVVWDSHGLRIEAANSSLQQILDEVSAETGVKVQGFGTDERVFGSYGPGAAREVISQLLEGSGYNVLMVGGQGSGAPLEIVLSERPAGAPQPVAQSQSAAQNQPAEADDNDAETDQAQPPPQPPPVPAPMRSGFAPGTAPRTPQQIMEELRARQLQMQNNNPQD